MPANKTALSAEKQAQKNFLNMLVMLAAPAAIAWYYYGFRSLLLIAVCIGSAAVCDIIGSLLIKNKKKTLYDFSAVFTGAVIAMMLPASFPFALAAAGCAFAVIVMKLPFGGTKSAPFMPAAGGFAFMCVCWPEKVFDYPAISAQFKLLSSAVATGMPGTSLAGMLHAGNSMRINSVSLLNFVTGNFPGPMGTGCILVLIAAAVYFLFTRPGVLLNSLGMVVSCGIFALLFPRIIIGSDAFIGRLSSAVFELCSGSLVFAALFILTDNAASPQKPLHRLLYGALTGTLCMLLRCFGVFEEGVCFAVLLSNAAWPLTESRLDRGFSNAAKKTGKKPAAPSIAEKGGGADA